MPQTASTIVILRAIARRLSLVQEDRATARARFPSILVEGDLGLGGAVPEGFSIMAWRA